MKYQKGNIIELVKSGKFDAIAHGCNCFCTMGAGIAKQIKYAFPLVYYADLLTESGDKSKLGKIVPVLIKEKDKSFYVINAYTQYVYSSTKKAVDYTALRECFVEINKEFAGKKVGIPKIGCGLAGGDWNIVERIIDSVTIDCEITCVLFEDEK